MTTITRNILTAAKITAVVTGTVAAVGLVMVVTLINPWCGLLLSANMLMLTAIVLS